MNLWKTQLLFCFWVFNFILIMPDVRMTNPNTVFEIDWVHRDGTRIYATIKIDHCYNRIEDLGLVFDSFCEDLPSLLTQQDTSR